MARKAKTLLTGKLIVIDGGDGAGKATQTALVVKALRKAGYKTETIDFPRYYDNFFGAFIGECLAGRHGDFLKKDPYVASVLYAADRFEASGTIKKWLEEGKVVITDRYVSGNQIHQGGKIADSKERKKFLQWLDTMEHGIFGIPRPTAILFLDVSVEVAQKLLQNEDKRGKKYLEGQKDLAESSIKHLEAARRSAVAMLSEGKNWVRIQCMEDGTMRSKEAIHKDIFRVVSNILQS